MKHSLAKTNSTDDDDMPPEVTSSKAASTEVGLPFERGMSTPLKFKI
jgi:hypothetical protein